MLTLTKRSFIALFTTSLLVLGAAGCTEDNTTGNNASNGIEDSGGQDSAGGDVTTDSTTDSEPPGDSSGDTAEDSSGDTADGGDDVSDAADDTTSDTANDGGDTVDSADTNACPSRNYCENACYSEDGDCTACPDPNEAGTTYAGNPDECSTINFSCGNDERRFTDPVCGCGCIDDSDPCAAQDITGGGTCTTELGVKWNGQDCVSVSGCSCVGSDCIFIYADLTSCHIDHSECGTTSPCASQDASGVGACTQVLGVKWTGYRCRSISGCTCQGTDCNSLFSSQADCESAYSQCLSSSGDCDGDTCTSDEYCDWSDNECGTTNASATCTTRPQICPTVVDPVCGCDGSTYNNDCEAAAAGVDVDYQGTCQN